MDELSKEATKTITFWEKQLMEQQTKRQEAERNVAMLSHENSQLHLELNNQLRN
jgi:hypothetical protein